MLDLESFNGMNSDELVTQWNIALTKEFVMERDYPQSTPLPDGKTLLIVGGDVIGGPQTLTFNGETMSWDTTYQKFEDPPFGNRHM